MVVLLAYLAIALWLTPGILLFGYLLWIVYGLPLVNNEARSARNQVSNR